MKLLALQTLATFNSAIFETLLYEMLDRLMIQAERQEQRLDDPLGKLDPSGRLYPWEPQLYLPKRRLVEEHSAGRDRCHLIGDTAHATLRDREIESEVDGVVWVASLVTDLQGTIVFGNPGVERLFQTSLNDLLGQPLAEIKAVSPLEIKIPQFLNGFQLALQGEFLELEGWMAHPSIHQTQKNCSYQLNYHPIFDGVGILQGVCIVFRMHESFKLEYLQADSTQSKRYKRPPEPQPTLPAAHSSISPSSWLQAIHRQLMEGECLETIAPGVLENLRQGFHCDQVLLYQLQDDGNAKVIFESVANPSLSLQGQSIQGSYFLRNHQGLTHPQIWMMDDQQQVCLTSSRSFSPFPLSCKDAMPTGMLREHSLLPQLQVKSCVAIPLVLRRSMASPVNREIAKSKGSLPWGWLVIHQWDEPRPWQTEEVDLLCTIAAQLSFAIQQFQLSQQLAELQDQLEVKVLEKTVELQNQVQELQQLNHLKDDFLSIVAHELRAPLANMNMAIKMLSLTIPNYSLETTNSEGCETKVSRTSNRKIYQRHHTYLDILQTECKRETDLINDLLDLQKLEANSFPIHPEVVNLNEWLPSVIEPFRSRIQQRHQVLKVEIPEHLSPIFTDTSCLGRVLAELLNNACKYTPRQEEIIFRVQETTLNTACATLRDTACATLRDTACATLRDTACATLRDRTTGNIRFILCNHANISPEELPRIFDKFYRVPHADIDKQGGTGLGLALVRQLVEQLEATLQVDSQAGWTTFMIDIPCQPSAPHLNNDYERLAG